MLPDGEEGKPSSEIPAASNASSVVRLLVTPELLVELELDELEEEPELPPPELLLPDPAETKNTSLPDEEDDPLFAEEPPPPPPPPQAVKKSNVTKRISVFMMSPTFEMGSIQI